MINIDVVKKSIYESSYTDFFCDGWNVLETKPLQLNFHHWLIGNKLQYAGLRVANGLPCEKPLMINLSPGQSKTRLCTEIFVPWLLAMNPGLKIIIGSFSLDTSNKFSSEIRKVMESSWYKKYFPNAALQKDNNRASRFYTIANGSVETVSPGSATTTKHADVIILDDISSAAQAASPVMNSAIIQWYEESLKSRVTSLTETLMVVVGHLYHSQDIFAHLLSKQEYDRIVLPALLNENIIPSIEEIQSVYSEAYTLGTMDAMRMPLDVLKDLESKTNPDVWQSQYMQDAPDLRTIVFQPDWVERIPYSEGIILGKGKTRHCVIDSAGSEKASADETAIGIFFYTEGRLYLESCYAVRYELRKLVPYIAGILGKHGIGNNSKVLIENAGPTGAALLKDLGAANFNAIAISHEGKSKAERMNDDAVLIPVMAKRFAVVEHLNAGKFYSQFTGALKLRRDDLRDMGVYAVKHLMEGNEHAGITLSFPGLGSYSTKGGLKYEVQRPRQWQSYDNGKFR